MIMNEQKTKSKVAAGLLAIFLGTLGIHKFYLGYITEGIIMLCVTLLTAGLLAAIVEIISIIEGIIYLTMDNNQFYATYVANKKGWF